MKEERGLIVNKDTAIGEIRTKTHEYSVVIFPSENGVATVFSSVPEIVNKLIKGNESEHTNFPPGMYAFPFSNTGQAFTFLAEHHLVIGYDHIDNLNE